MKILDCMKPEVVCRDIGGEMEQGSILVKVGERHHLDQIRLGHDICNRAKMASSLSAAAGYTIQEPLLHSSALTLQMAAPSRSHSTG